MTPSVLDGATPEHWRMVEDNTRLVWFFIHKYRIPEQRRDDAFQDGCLGLLRAAMKFDPTKGYTFSTYAKQFVQQYIERGHGRLEGANYRRAKYYELSEYEMPASLDAPLAHDSSFALVDTLVDDEHVDEAVTFETTLDELPCRDQLDEDLVAMMRAGYERGRLQVLASSYGLSHEAVRRRWKRLNSIAARHFQAAA